MFPNIIIPRQWSRFTCLCRLSSTSDKNTNKSSNGISPPARIPRGPTDILQALASTVGNDITAAHYKYHDDPYLLPLSNYHKRSYALSAESGRKAAAWVRDNHADLFVTREWDPPTKMKTPYYNADPIIDAFAPRPVYNSINEVTEDDLWYTIKNAMLEDSITVYNKLSNAGEISNDLKLALLQFLCFYNEKEPSSLEWLEERWFSSNSKQRYSTTWKLGGLADKLFNSMDPKPAKAYCAIIQGMAKYFQAEKAHSLCKEALDSGIPLSTNVYNDLMGCIGFLYEGYAQRITALQTLLTEMNNQGLTPNDETLVECLKSVSCWGSGQSVQKFALQLVAEFKQLGIHPGLSAYYYLLRTFCKERGPSIDILTEILNDLESRPELEPTMTSDINFFVTAMHVCVDHLQDPVLADRVHALLMKGNNYQLVGDSYLESIYYRHYVTVTCRYSSFENTCKLIDTLIPNIYIPEPSAIEEIIKVLDLAACGDRLAQVWSQLVMFNQSNRLNLIEMLLSAMNKAYSLQDEDVKLKIRNAASEIYKHKLDIEKENEAQNRRTPIQFNLSANSVANIIEICSDVKDKEDPHWETVTMAMDNLKKEQSVGVPSSPIVLQELAKKAVTLGNPSLAATAIAYLAEQGFDTAIEASLETLEVMMNRPRKEIKELLKKPLTELDASLHPSALDVVKSYKLAQSGGSTFSSSSSDSSSDSSDSE